MWCIGPDRADLWTTEHRRTLNPPAMRSTILVAAASLQLAAHAQLTNGCFTIGGPEYELARAVVQTTDGGYAFAGLTISYNTTNVPQSMYVVKTDANGAVQWNTSYEHPLFTSIGVATDMIQTTDGGYAVAGVSTQSSMGLVKLDATGTVQWSKQYDTAADLFDDVNAMVQTPDGGYLLAALAVNGKMVLIKTDAVGEIEWSKAYDSGFGTGTPYDVVVALGGGYAVCGHQSNTSQGLHVLRVDENGDVLWGKRYGMDIDLAHAIAATPDSGFVVAGFTYSYGFAVYGQEQDAFVVKIDQGGGLEWARAFGDTMLSEIFYGVVPTSDGGYAMAGEVTHISGIGVPRFFVAKCDANGERLWSQKLNGANQRGVAYDIIECTDGGLAVTGLMNIPTNNAQCAFMKMEADGTICPACGPEPYGRDSTAVFIPEDITYTVSDGVATSADYTAVVVQGGVVEGDCLETGIAEGTSTANVITIAPNPAMDQCSVSLGNATDIEGLEVLSSQGVLITYIPVNGRTQVVLPVARLAQGVYVIRAIGSARPQQVRLVVMDR